MSHPTKLAATKFGGTHVPATKVADSLQQKLLLPETKVAAAHNKSCCCPQLKLLTPATKVARNKRMMQIAPSSIGRVKRSIMRLGWVSPLLLALPVYKCSGLEKTSTNHHQLPTDLASLQASRGPK